MRYAYDKLSRIIREDNKALQATYLFTYDNNGNILSKRAAAFSLSVSTEHLTEFQDELYYGYDAANPDRLVYRAGGNLPTPQVYAYDAFGNPTQYGGTVLTWKNGRQLASYGSLQFTYDGTGKRIKKGDTTYTYDIGGKPVQQSNGTDTLEFFYDQSGLSGCKHGPAQYVYRKNLQGDITHIFSIDGDLKACYTYDAWGNHDVVCYGADGQVTADASHIGNLNPFRYRSYLYDTETGWYFLKTRYYDPQVGRFISQDAVEYLDPETVNGLNLYAYCGDNPVMRVDPNGTIWKEIGRNLTQALANIGKGIVGFALAVIGLVVTAVSAPVAFLPGSGFATQFGATTFMFGLATMVSISDEQIQKDMDAIRWNPFNRNEQAVLGSEMISFYRGMPVLRMDGGRSGSFLVICLARGDNANDLRHEWGHGVQHGFLSTPLYLVTVGITSPFALGPWSKQNVPDAYYNAPWETMADIFGGATRTQVPQAGLRAWLYLVTSIIFLPATYLFLLWE